MKKNIITFIFILFVISTSFSQQNPFNLDNLPSSTKFEFVSEVDLHVTNYKSELYFANINSETTLSYIITQNLPDCLIVTNQFDGLDIYKKLTKGGFERIVHIRKAGETFKVFYINKDNENDKLVLTASVSEGHNSISVMKIAYTLYWNNVS
jgi:hypothetical protein